MKTDLIVVGAGIAGSSLARAARARGLEVTVVSLGTPDSTAALAALRGAYHKGAEIPRYARSVELLLEWGCVVAEGATVTNYRSPGVERLDLDWLLIDPIKPLVAPDIDSWATQVDANTVKLDISHFSQELTAEHIVFCVGAHRESGRISHGYTMSHPDPGALVRSHMRVHHMAPYKSVMMGLVNGQPRLGSTSAPTEGQARAQIAKMLDAADDAGLITTRSGWIAEYGRRVQVSDRLTPGNFGGFHRTGYALAPAMAEEFVEVFL